MPRKHHPHQPRSPRPTLLEPLESRILLSAIPTGSVDILNKSQIVGWAYDKDDASAPINVKITVNGTPTTLTANATRNDLTAHLGSPYHGFVFTMPTLPIGKSTILIQAVSPSTGAFATLKSTTLTNAAPKGYLDVVSSTRIAGWAYDPDSTSPVRIRIDVDGVAQTPFTTNVARPAVAPTAHNATAGFDVSGSFAGHVVEVFALDASSGQPTLLYTNNNRPTGYVDLSNAYSVVGWAYDPDNPSASINVQINIDGSPLTGSPAPANVTRAGLTSVIGSSNHGFSVAIPGLNPGTHTISVYALDGQASSAAPVLLSSKKFTDNPPVGHVDTVNSSIIKGWALDKDLGAAPVNVSVYVDHTFFATVPANGYRPDLTKTYGSPSHGFSVNLSSLPPGSHSITVTAADNRISPESDVVIFDNFINNHQPRGYLEVIANNTLAGWAQDPDTASSPINVDIYVDGAYNTTTTANITRNDLTPVLGSPNHGFSVDLPPLTFGTHKIDVYAAESQNNVSTRIGSLSITNNRPIGNIDVLNTTTIAGWVFDKDTATQSLDIKLYINGTFFSTTTASLTRNDLTPTFGSPNHGFSITLPTLSPGQNHIDIYAVDKNNNLISLLKSTTLTP